MQLLRQFNKSIDEATAKERAAALYLSTKGVRQYVDDNGVEISKEDFFQLRGARCAHCAAAHL